MIFPSPSAIIATLVIFGSLFAALRRPRTACVLSLYLLALVVLSSAIKQAYLGVAMSLADVRFFLLAPRENFHIFIQYPLLGLALLGLGAGFALCVAAGLRYERPVHFMVSAPHGHRFRITAAAVSLMLAIGATMMPGEGIRAQVMQDEMYAAYQTMNEMERITGVINRLNFFFNNRIVQASLPAFHQQTRFEVPAPSATAALAGIQPDIFMILEESTFDPTLISGCAASDCDNAMLHPLPLALRTQQGPLMVHSSGGGTWLSEFALMSGFDWRVFGYSGAYAPVSLAPRLQTTLPAKLRALGYRTIALYPTEGNFLSAKSAYGFYGFEEFYAASDLKLPKDWELTYDHMVFDKALALAQNPADTRPVFIFALTVRNHGPHGNGMVQVAAGFHAAEQQQGGALADYLGRMRDSSTDFVRLAEQWLQSPRPRIVGWFGDHQPEAAWKYTQHPERLLRDNVAINASDKQIPFLTQYQLSANFGEQGQLLSKSALDISYLGTQLLAFAGLPLDAGASAGRAVAAKCNGLMLECSDHELINDYLSYRIYQLAEMH